CQTCQKHGQVSDLPHILQLASFGGDFNDLATCRGYRLRLGHSHKCLSEYNLRIGQDTTWPLFASKVAMWCICAAARPNVRSVPSPDLAAYWSIASSVLCAGTARNSARLGSVQPATKLRLPNRPVVCLDHFFLRIRSAHKLLPKHLSPGRLRRPLLVPRIGRQQAIVHTQGMGAATRPAVLPGVVHQVRCDRIALDGAAATQQVGLRFDRRALESALKHVAPQTGSASGSNGRRQPACWP